MKSHHESECLAPAEDALTGFIFPFVSFLVTSTKYSFYCTVLKKINLYVMTYYVGF